MKKRKVTNSFVVKYKSYTGKIFEDRLTDVICIKDDDTEKWTILETNYSFHRYPKNKVISIYYDELSEIEL